MHMAAAKVQGAKNNMATPAASPTSLFFVPSTMPLTPRRPLPLLLLSLSLSLSLPALLLLLSLVFLLSHTTFSLLLRPLLPQSPSRPNVTTATTTSLDVSMDKTLRAFHVSSPPPPPSKPNATTTTTASLDVSKDTLRDFHVSSPPPPPPPSKPNATTTTTTSLDVSMDKTLRAFHVSPPPPPPPPAVKTNSKKVSTKRNKSLLKILSRQTPRTRRFAARAAELFASPRPCAHRFFMTWLSPLEKFGRRELLVVESLFRWHRDACLLIASDTLDSEGGSDRLRPFLEHGFRVAAASPDLAYLLSGTPAEAWLGTVQRGDISLGSVPLGQNLSNLLRLALLYKYGGVYLDADVVVLRSFSDLRNAIGAQAVDAATGDWMRLNNAVMLFDRGHPLLREFIAEFTTTFDGSKWGHNGPYLVSRVTARLRRQGPGLDVTVLPPRAFYPVDWNKIGGLFLAPKDRKDERWVKAKVDNIKGESFGIHLWSRESRSLEMEEGSVIGMLLSDSCLFCNSSMFLEQE